MKSPLGFGKRYFSLASIQAHSVQVTLDKVCTVSKSLRYSTFAHDKDKEDEDPPLIVETNCLFLNIQASKPCHCNCYFNKKSKLALCASKKIKKCQCHSKCFSFRRSGIHPPAIALPTPVFF